MCGIVGIGSYAGSAISMYERDAFMDMLVADSARGVHGTGIFRINPKGGKVDWAKAYGTPFDLFRSEGFHEGFWETTTSLYIRWLVGHNRYATTGAKDTASAHPFEVGNITLIHNGTLRTFNLPEFKEKEYKVDSHAVCAAINRIGIKETLKGFTGAYVLVYYDKKAKTLNLIRNWERPLYIGTCKKDKVVAFASEEHLLTWACERNRIYLDKIEELPEGMLYSYGLDEIKPKIQQLVEPHSYPSSSTKDDKNGVEKDGSFWHNGEHWILNTTTGVYFKEGEQIVSASQVTSETGEQEKTYAKKKNSWDPLPAVLATSKKDKGEKNTFATTLYSGISIGEMVEFFFEDYDKTGITAEGTQTYMLSGKDGKRTDIIFKCRIKGTESLDTLMQCEKIQAKVVSIHCPQDYQQPVIFYVAFPNPIWKKIPASYAAVPEPLDDSIVPASALIQLANDE